MICLTNYIKDLVMYELFFKTSKVFHGIAHNYLNCE